MTSRTDAGGTITFAHDSDGRLSSAMNSSFDLDTYQYDALGRRIRVDEPYRVPLLFTYDGDNVVMTRQSAGSHTAKKYQNGPGIDNA